MSHCKPRGYRHEEWPHDTHLQSIHLARHTAQQVRGKVGYLRSRAKLVPWGDLLLRFASQGEGIARALDGVALMHGVGRAPLGTSACQEVNRANAWMRRCDVEVSRHVITRHQAPPVGLTHAEFNHEP